MVAARGYAQFSAQERAVVERNLRRIHGDDLDESRLQHGVDRVFENYGRYWLDSLRLTHMTPEQIDDGFSYEGIHHLIDPIHAGITPVVAMPHLGGWEWAAAWLTKVKGWPVASVAERLEPPELFDWFLDFRQQLGMHIIAAGPERRGRGGRPSWRRARSSACCATATSAVTASWWSSSASGPVCPVVRR